MHRGGDHLFDILRASDYAGFKCTCQATVQSYKQDNIILQKLSESKHLPKGQVGFLPHPLL